MEREYFTWASCDVLRPAMLRFANCTLVKPISHWERGSIFGTIDVDLERSTMVLRDWDGEKLYACNVRMVLGHEID